MYDCILLSTGPFVPDSQFFKHMTLETSEVVVIGSLMTIGLVVATTLLAFNIVWRNNK